MADPITTLGGSGMVVPIPALGSKKPETKASSVELSAQASNAVVPGALESAAPAPQETDPASFKEAAKVVEAHMSALSTNLQFGVDKDTNIMTLKVIDSTTQKVIREYPAEEVLKMAKYIQESLKSKDTGLMVDMQH